MKIEQIYTGCLAEAAYYIESEGEAAIIDPLRETSPYLERAEVNHAKIKYIFETHFHADFVSGHIDLAQKTGGTIVYGPNAEANFEFHRAKDGEEFRIGKITIKAIHTPGHTMESTTYLLIDETGNNHALFTGDTLFIGDVGRPDLAVKTDLTREDLAGHLYESIYKKLLPLEDDVLLYPGHGAGSACGKKMSDETIDTLGHQKKSNYALQNLTKEEFIHQVLEGLMQPPQYFPKNALLNKMGYRNIDSILEKGLTSLKISQFREKFNEPGIIILDTRDPEDYIKGSVPGSINIGLDGSFAVWVGTLITSLNSPIVFIAPEGKEEETVIRLARVGYDNTIGYLEGGFKTWKDAGEEIQKIPSISPMNLENSLKTGELAIVDVRNPQEHLSGHAEGSISYPLDYINDHLEDLDKDKLYYFYCQGGYRSVIAASILKIHGFNNISIVEGGYDEMVNTQIPRTGAGKATA